MRRLASHLALSVILGLLTAIVLTAGIGWLLAALWLALQTALSPAAAAAWTGLVAVAVAGVIAAAAYASRRSPVRRSPAPDAASGFEEEVAGRLAALAGRDAAAFVAAHPGRAAVVALALGLAVGASPRLRAALRDLLK
jgi:hypothetical protein